MTAPGEGTEGDVEKVVYGAMPPADMAWMVGLTPPQIEGVRAEIARLKIEVETLDELLQEERIAGLAMEGKLEKATAWLLSETDINTALHQECGELEAALAGVRAALGKWRVWRKNGTMTLAHGTDGDAPTVDEWTEIGHALAVLASSEPPTPAAHQSCMDADCIVCRPTSDWR